MNKQHEERKKIIYALMQDKTYVPMKIKELAIILQVSKEDRGELEAILDELIREGLITLTKRGKYVIRKDEILTGLFSSTAHGYGFVTVEGESDDYFVSEKNCKDAMHGDTVSIAVTKQASAGKRKEELEDVNIDNDENPEDNLEENINELENEEEISENNEKTD